MMAAGKSKVSTGKVGSGPKPSKKFVKTRVAQRQATPTAESKKIALWAAESALDKKASAVDIIDVSGKVDYADYLVLMTGLNERHVAAIARAVDDGLAKNGVRSVAVEGLPSARWVLIDFVDVVVHVFLKDARSLYDLDGLWLDAKRIAVATPGSRSE
jgi:ribosome-associated protein